MSAPVIVAMAAFISVISLVLLVSAAMNRRPAAVRRRLQDHSVAVTASEAHRVERINVLKARGIEDAALGNSGSRLSRSKIVRTAARELSRAGVTTTVRRYLLIRVLLGVVLAVVAAVVLGNPLFAIPAAIVGMMAPRFLVRRKGKGRLLAFEAQLAESIDLFVGALRAGHGFLQGLESVANQMEDPTKQEYGRVLEEVNVGIGPVDALVSMHRRIPSYDVGLLVSAIAVQRQTGGNLAEVLENLAATVRERRRVRGEVQALTTGPRVSSYVLGLIPTLLFFYFLAISSDYRDIMLGTTYGHMLIGLAAVLSFLGYFFARKVSKVEY